MSTATEREQLADLQYIAGNRALTGEMRQYGNTYAKLKLMNRVSQGVLKHIENVLPTIHYPSGEVTQQVVRVITPRGIVELTEPDDEFPSDTLIAQIGLLV